MGNDSNVLKIVIIGIIVVFVLPMLLMVLILPVMGMWNGPHMFNGWMGSGVAPGVVGLIWFLMTVLFLMIIVGVGFLILRAATSTTEEDDPAIQELRKAYARGDLTEEEFETKMERLQVDD